MRINDEKAEFNDLVLKRLKELEFWDKLEQQIKYERLTGAGCMFLNLSYKGAKEFDFSIGKENKKLNKIEFINVFNKWDIKSYEIENSILNKNYKNIISYNLEKAKIHSDYVGLLCSSKNDEDDLGTSLINALYRAIWSSQKMVESIGKISFQILFRELKLGNVNFDNIGEYIAKTNFIREQAETNNLIVLDGSSSAAYKTPGSLPNLEHFDKVLWNQITTTSQIPKSILTGKQEGVTTGGSYDIENYYFRLMGYWNKYCVPIVKKVIDLILEENNIQERDYEIFKWPLWEITEREQAEIEEIKSKTYKAIAEADSIRLNSGVISVDDLKNDNYKDMLERIKDIRVDEYKELLDG